jgi:hypothetical protein
VKQRYTAARMHLGSMEMPHRRSPITHTVVDPLTGKPRSSPQALPTHVHPVEIMTTGKSRSEQTDEGKSTPSLLAWRDM